MDWKRETSDAERYQSVFYLREQKLLMEWGKERLRKHQGDEATRDLLKKLTLITERTNQPKQPI